VGDFCLRRLAEGVMAEALAADDGEFVRGGGFGKTAEAVGGFCGRCITSLKRGVNERRPIRIKITIKISL